ncbi:N-acetylneuraminate synthase family protein [Pseudochryseolinea flava]|uniref:N-acetylneuraminate synthase n=1 Tax=Pseudochryseolinea flava TaxID=2059302 RepID=A0A364Y1C3_9BACT|nr:N-acetylneuraminate synthase family protein [Pseudochryseolinea flava]RAV99749.1 N-acetylneuraminate synthase [Pseudochryseolinea flava]
MKTQIIAEIAQAHDGSVGILHSYIDVLAKAGVDAVKFQTHIAEAESSAHEPFRVRFSRVDQTRFDYWKRMEFSASQWKEIKDHCDEVGVEFLSSPFSIAAVDLLESLGMRRYKIASGEVTNDLLLTKIAETKKPVILSSGMSTWEELERAFHFFNKQGIDTSVLQCTTMYPTPAERLGLEIIAELKRRFQCKVGFSDHSGTIVSAIAARSLGAEILEFHAVFDKRMFGPDAASSLTIDEIQELVENVRFLDRAFDHPVDKNDVERYKESKKMFGKSLAVRKDLPEGHVLTFDDLESKKPEGYGIPARDFRIVLNKKLRRSISKYSFLNYEDIA